MSRSTSPYTKQTAREALCWLNTQKEDWAKQIRDVDVAVQLYLNFKNRKRVEKRAFSNELQKLCINGSVPVETPEQNEKPDRNLSSDTDRDLYSPVLKNSVCVEEIPASGGRRTSQNKPCLTPQDSNRTGMTLSFPPLPSSVLLDERTRELLARATARLNLSHEKEALNVLVQLGFSSLQNLLKDL